MITATAVNYPIDLDRIGIKRSNDLQFRMVALKVIQHRTPQVTQSHQRHILHLRRIDDLADAVHQLPDIIPMDREP